MTFIGNQRHGDSVGNKKRMLYAKEKIIKYSGISRSRPNTASKHENQIYLLRTRIRNRTEKNQGCVG